MPSVAFARSLGCSRLQRRPARRLGLALDRPGQSTEQAGERGSGLGWPRSFEIPEHAVGVRTQRKARWGGCAVRNAVAPRAGGHVRSGPSRFRFSERSTPRTTCHGVQPEPGAPSPLRTASQQPVVFRPLRQTRYRSLAAPRSGPHAPLIRKIDAVPLPSRGDRTGAASGRRLIRSSQCCQAVACFERATPCVRARSRRPHALEP